MSDAFAESEGESPLDAHAYYASDTLTPGVEEPSLTVSQPPGPSPCLVPANSSSWF